MDLNSIWFIINLNSCEFIIYNIKTLKKNQIKISRITYFIYILNIFKIHFKTTLFKLILFIHLSTDYESAYMRIYINAFFLATCNILLCRVQEGLHPLYSLRGFAIWYASTFGNTSYSLLFPGPVRFPKPEISSSRERKFLFLPPWRTGDFTGLRNLLWETNESLIRISFCFCKFFFLFFF